MRLTKYIFIPALIATMLFAVAARSWAQFKPRGSSGESQELNVTADKLSTGNGGSQMEATGNVEIKRQEMTLKADEVRINRATQDVDAKGKVSVDTPEWKLKSADAMQMNLENETGEFQKGDLFLEEGHISMSGRRFQKFTGQSYHIDDGFFTTCLCESGAPSWKVSAEQMDLTLDGSGTIKNGYFYIMDVPVLYLPYGVFPLRTERQTGFLFPKFGHSSKEGFRFLQPFFWAMSKSTDATVAFDIESRARAGLLGEFRTMFSRDADFRLDASYFNEAFRKNAQQAVVDRTIADQDIPKNRWSLIGTHRYTSASDWLTFSDFAAYRDDLFTRELVDRFDLPRSQEAAMRESRYSASRFGLFKSWGDMFFKGEWNFFQDFIQPDATTLQRTPQLAFWGRRFLSDFPLEFRWRGEGVNYIRREGGDGLRFDLRPEVVLPFKAGPYLFGSLSAAPRETFYHLYTPVKSSDHNVSRQLVEMRANVGTTLSRIYTPYRADLSGLKHVIEPELSYLFVPKTNQSRIPIMDDVDRVNRRNVLTLAVTNRLWGKFVNPLAALPSDENVELLNAAGPSDTRDLGYLKFALSYDIDKERKGGDTLSDLDITLRLNPLSFVNLGFDGRFDPGPWRPSLISASISVTDPRPLSRRSLDPDFNRPNTVGLGYSFLRNNANSFLAQDANINLDAPADCAKHPDDPRCPGADLSKIAAGNINANLFYHATDNILLLLSSSFDTRNSRFLGFNASTKLLSWCECWSVTLGLKRNINPAKTSFNFDFNLLGLGSSKSSLK